MVAQSTMMRVGHTAVSADASFRYTIVGSSVIFFVSECLLDIYTPPKNPKRVVLLAAATYRAVHVAFTAAFPTGVAVGPSLPIMPDIDWIASRVPDPFRATMAVVTASHTHGAFAKPCTDRAMALACAT